MEEMSEVEKDSIAELCEMMKLIDQKLDAKANKQKITAKRRKRLIKSLKRNK